jgi:hypothetical protein
MFSREDPGLAAACLTARMATRSNSALNSQPISKDSENVHPHKRSVVRIAPGQT